MAFAYVARSADLSKWGADVGLGKHLFKVGLAEDGAEAAVKELAASRHGGSTDWTLVKKQAVESVDEAAMIERLAAKEKMVDPNLYPRIKGAVGIFKVKLVEVENSLLLKQALAGHEPKLVKLKNADIAGYLLTGALE